MVSLINRTASTNGKHHPDRTELLEAVDIAALLDTLGLDYLEQGDHYMALCPFHADGDRPNLSVGPKPAYHCFSCGVSGSLIDLVAHWRAGYEEGNNGKAAIADAFKWLETFVEEAQPVARERREKMPKPEPAPLDPSLLGEWVHNLWAAEGEPLLKYLLEERGLTKRTVQSFDLGYDAVSDRITIPVYDVDDNLVNVRKYHPGAKHNKVVSYAEGYGRNRRMNPQSGQAEFVLLVAGEMDYLVARNLGFDGADTFTAGEAYKPKPHEVEDWRDKVVYVFYDNDAAGRKGADTVRNALGPEGFEVNVVPFPEGYPEKYDLSDLVNKEGWTEEQVRALLDAPAPTTLPNVTPTPPPHTTDVGNGILLAQLARDQVVWVERWRKWLAFDGKRWAPDEYGLVRRAAKGLSDEWLRLALAAPDIDTRDEFAKWATRECRTRKTIDNAIELTKSEVGMSAVPSDFDTHPTLFNVQNGTLDLDTMTLRPHDRTDRETRIANADYAPDAYSARWDAFLDKILPDPDLRGFMQRALGSALYGGNPDQAFYVLYASQGRAGRSMMCETIGLVLGDYRRGIDANVMMEGGNRSQSTGNRDALANLQGKRYVDASETNSASTAKLDVPTVKWITGGDTLTVMRKYEQEFSFRPEFTVFLRTNEKPAIESPSASIWERVYLVDCSSSYIPKDQRRPYDELQRELLAESDGILAWLLRGYVDWKQGGLRAPASVVAATAEYQKDSDVVGAFLEARTEYNPTARATEGERVTRVREAFEDWAQREARDPVDRRSFTAQLEAKRMVRTNDSSGNKIWRGLSIKHRPNPMQTHVSTDDR